MCGICGIFNLDHQPVIEASVTGMMDAIRHRGPDDDGRFLENSVGLGFVRLSIIDLSPGGHQPMVSQDERYVLVFNGEIYNHIELRKELEHLGSRFRSHSDTEVLLESYIQWGDQCLHRFNGAFAFAIYDRKERSLFCARDRFGVKPFYYSIEGKTFIFASEPIALLKARKKAPAADHQRIYDFLVFNRTDHDPESFFEDIVKLPHGHVLKISDGKVLVERWYDLAARISPRSLAPYEYYDMLRSSISLRMRSDVPVGLTLSGGLDSSSIASILCKDLGAADIHTFSAVYQKGTPCDESAYVELFRGQLKNLHLIYPVHDELLRDIGRFVADQQEPFGTTSIYASYKIMSEASSDVKVMLNGQGADETLAGYEDFHGIYQLQLLRSGRLARFFSESSAFISTHRSLYGLKAALYYGLPGKLQTSVRVRDKGYLSPGFVKRHAASSTVTRKIFRFKNMDEALLGHMEHKLEHLLKWDDRNTMRFGIEARNPFLDYRLVEATLGSPDEAKISRGYTKSILRAAMKGVLPEKIRTRKDKIGFATPEAEWFRTPGFRKMILEVLESESFRSRGIIDPEKAKSLYERHCAKKISISKEVWKWVNLELWFRKFIDR